MSQWNKRLLTYLLFGDWIIPFAATGAAKIANAFEWPRQPLKIVPPLTGSAPHVIYGSVGPPESSSKTACRSLQPFLHCRVSHYFTMGRYVFPQKLPLAFGDLVPRLTHGTYGPFETNTIRVINPNGISIGSAVFVWVPNTTLYNTLSIGKKTPKLPLPLEFRHPAGGGPSHGHRQHA